MYCHVLSVLLTGQKKKKKKKKKKEDQCLLPHYCLFSPAHQFYITAKDSKMALLCSDAVQVAPLRLCFYLLFYLLLISLFTHITSALITYDKGTLLDIGNRFTNLVQDTLSLNPSWPLEILRNAENKGHRRRIKKHRGKKRWYSQQTEEKGSQSSFTEHSAR